MSKIMDKISLNSIECYEGDEFVRQAYRVILGREVDTDAFLYYSKLLEHDKLRKIDIITRLRLSPEGRNNAVKLENFWLKAICSIIRQTPILGTIVFYPLDFLLSPIHLKHLSQQNIQLKRDFYGLSKKINDISQTTCIEKSKQQIPLRDNKQKYLFIAISKLHFCDNTTSAQRVTRSILKQILDNPPIGYKAVPVYATLEEQGYRYAQKLTYNFINTANSMEEDFLIEYKRGDIFLILDYQYDVIQVQKNELDAIFSMGIPIISVVHDLLLYNFPHFFRSDLKPIFTEWLHIISYYTGCLCVSHNTAQDLLTWQHENLPTPPSINRVSYFHNGHDFDSSVSTVGIPENAHIVFYEIAKRPTVLMVNTIELSAGYAQALEAFNILWDENFDINLIIVGAQGWGVDELVSQINEHVENGKRLFWLQGISDEYLQKIYTVCTVCLNASLGEGFGLSLIEAAFCQKPLIIRDIPVFREIAGSHAHYFSGTDAYSLKKAIEHWFILYKQDIHPLTINMKIFTRAKSTQMLLKAMFKLIDNAKQEFPFSNTIRIIAINIQTRDAVGNFCLDFANKLEKDGYRVYLYAQNTDSLTRSKVKHISQLDEDLHTTDIIIYNYAIYDENFPNVSEMKCYKKILYFHNVTPSEFFKPYTEEFAEILEISLEQYNYFKNYDAVIANSNYSLKQAHPYCVVKAQTLTLPPYFSLPIVKAKPKKVSLYSKIPTILWVSRFVPHKRPELAIHIFEKLTDLGTDANLVFVGRGQHDFPLFSDFFEKKLSLLPQKTQSRITFLGSISTEKLAYLYKNTNLLLCTSAHEGYGMPIVEAMAFGLPVAIMPQEAMIETLGDYEHGYILPENTTQAAIQIQEILQNSPNVASRKSKILDSSLQFEQVINLFKSR